jgi:glycerophosphoryl diester phosphodiesterase
MTAQQLSTRHHPSVIAHRGSSGRALENTLSAFRLAVEERCDGVELDIHLSRDGAIVVHHDPQLRGGAAIASRSLAELRRIRLADGSPVPTLSEVLQVTGGLDVHVEAKTLPPEGDDRLLQLIQEAAHPERLHVHSFDHRIIARLAARNPALSLGVLSTSYPVDPVGMVLGAGARTLWQERDLIDRDLVERCTQAEIAVIAWTVNDADEAARLTRLGVAGLCGNWPERLRG